MRRTKIVCTIGPATESLETMEALVRRGDGRGSTQLFAWLGRRTPRRGSNLIREGRGKAGRAVGILIDIQGPRSASGDLPERTGAFAWTRARTCMSDARPVS